jgi:glycosyltransferase involved in cell wall biosynthesis
LAWVLGPNGLQIVLCPDMEQRLRRLYGPQLPIAIIPSTIQLLAVNFEPEAVKDPAALSHGPIRIGHISNLQMAKGLDTVVEVLRVLRQRGRQVQLVLAGPVQSPLEQKFIDAAKQEFGPSLDYRGPVYGADKRRFFRDIHVKLFPTRYPDAQPLVVTEAFAFGCPVISYGRGCIPGMMGPAVEWSIPPADDFVEPAVRQIEGWIDDSASYANASRIARGRFDALMEEARQSMTEFERWVRREPDHGFVRRGSEISSATTCGSG